MYQKPGKLLKDLTFKIPGKPELYVSKTGKRVWVDRHSTEYGKYVVWSSGKKYAIVPGETLHEVVEFDTP
jgi:hypothetical protein